MKSTDKRCTRTLVVNVVKTIIAYIITSFLGYLAYRMLINGTNIQQPIGAGFRTSLLSIVVFALLIYLTVRIYNLPTKDERRLWEKQELYKQQTESGYTLDYKEYFKTQIKTRLWASLIPILVLQLPLIINYAMVSYAEGFTLYTSPITLFKFYMPSMFVWELVGGAWFLAPILFTAIYGAVFTTALYHSQKKFIPEKPEWYSKKENDSK